MKKNVAYIIIGVLIVGVLISNFRLYSLIADMNRDMRDMEYIVRNIDGNMNNIESKVYNSVNRLIEEKRWLYDVETRVKDISEDLKDATVALSWSVRELDKDAGMYLLYGVENEKSREVTEWKEISVQDSGDLSYRVELNLPFVNNYRFKVLAKGKDKTISQELDEIDFLDTIGERLDIDPQFNSKSAIGNHVNLGFSVYVRNRYDFNYWKGSVESFDVNILKIKNIKVRVYSNERLKKEIEIYKDGKVIDENASYSDPYKGDRDIKREEIDYDVNIEFDSVEDSYEMVEVIVEDYLGRTYVEKSHRM
ncbi:hypothetical protein R9X47_24515 [Wukongibacter baidiensis]|uniref:hypothetical protein n=1 Tax=Wukongibacter baidiensis TaxID=1723361 RepID=UPI003D7F1BB3